MAVAVRRSLLVLLGLLVLAVAWGFAEPHLILDEEERETTIPGLPSAWHGREVAFLSDLQVGIVWANEGTARDAVRRLVDDPPAAVLLGGDFVYSEGGDVASQVEIVAELLAPLGDASIPTYAVLGNHDVEAGAAEALRRALDGLGITVLHNQAVQLPTPDSASHDAPLWLVGIGPHIPGQDRPMQALAGVAEGEPRLVFMHNPDSFEGVPAGEAPLAIAGHTHGGQIRPVPFLPDWSLLALLRDDEVTADGWIDGYGAADNRLYVSRGIGMSRIPARFNCPPELTRMTLHRP